MKTYTRKRPEYQIIEGAKDLCRLCLKKAELSVPIFSDDSGNVCATLALRIMICVGLEMKNEDCLPNNICLDCHKELQRYYAFRKKCEVSYRKLKSHLLAVTIKEIGKNTEIKKEVIEQTKNDKKETSNISFRVNFDGSVHLCEGNTSQFEVKPLVTLTRMDDTRQTKMLQRNETLNHIEKTIFQSNPIVLNSKTIVPESKPIVLNSSRIVQESKPIVFNSNKIVPESKSIVCNSNTIPESKPTVFNSNTIAPESKQIVCNSQTIVTETDSIVFNSKTIVPESNEIVSNGNTIVSEGTLIVCENNVMLQSDIEVARKNELVQTGEVEMQNVITDADLSTFLSSLLIDLNVLTQRGDELIVDPQTRTVEVEAGDGRQVTWELMEEEIGEVSVQESNQENVPSSQLSLPLSVTVSSSEGNKNIIVEYINSDRLEGDSKKNAPTDKKLRQALQSAWCHLCRRRFASRSACSRHIRTVHSRQRPFVCKLCGKSFTQKEVMLRHELIHEVVRPFKCSQCAKSFTQRGALAAHARSHAPPHARALELHRCGVCPKVFLYASGLTRHMASHSGQRFECAGCKRHFGDKSSLNRHLKNTNHAACASLVKQSSKKT